MATNRHKKARKTKADHESAKVRNIEIRAEMIVPSVSAFRTFALS
jgi:hypothetical protein